MVIDYRYCPVGRSFYSPDLGRRQPLGEGLESWRGFYQSIRPTQMGLSLNIGIVFMRLSFSLCQSFLRAKMFIHVWLCLHLISEC